MDQNFTAEKLKSTGSSILAKVNEILVCTKAFSEATNNIAGYIKDGSSDLSTIWGNISTTYTSIGNKINDNVNALNAEIDRYIVSSMRFDREYEASVDKLSQAMDDFEKQLAAL